MTGTKPCVDCGTEFKKSPTDYTVRCPECRVPKTRAPKTHKYTAVECSRCGTTYTELRCPGCGF